MNFLYLEQYTEQKFDVSLTVIAVGQTKTVGAKNTALQECTLQEPAGRSEAVTIFQGSYSPPMNNTHVGQTLIFKLSHSVYKGKAQYAGYWQCPNPQENQPPAYQPQPQAPPQAPQQQPAYQPPPQAPRSQNVAPAASQEPRRNMEYAYEAAPYVAARIARSVALEAASRVAIGRANATSTDVLADAINFYDWLATGNIPMSPAGAALPEDEGTPPF